MGLLDDAKDKAEDAAEVVKDKAGDAADFVKDKADDVSDFVKDKAAEAKDRFGGDDKAATPPAATPAS
jgi:hypothetical protein